MTAPADWYKNAVIYQLHVRAFHDSDGDGIGDFKGLTQKLDYLQDLGVTALWLLPFYPSPLRDDGYDIADYTGVNPAYGTLQDFRVFLREAHRRGLKVITELVLNHTSDQHPWFQRARRSAPGSRARDFYVWSETVNRYTEARIIFKDFERSNWTWDDVAGAYYWHRFYSHQPDLNFDNPDVHRAVLAAFDFWLRMGVDGLRLDAVPYLYEREGTNCENLPETHSFLKELRAYVDERYENRMLLAEANQWPEDAVAYFGDGDECHMAFHFPVMPRLFMAVQMEDRFPIIDILQQTPSIPERSQWAVFLRNHDELTLEMVTDEDRDYMYRVYATDPQARINLGIRRRLAPLLGNNRRRIELMNALLFSLPGTPIVYYGDEIGMGDNIYLGDRNGVRTPMQWSADRNAGFSRGNPQKLYFPIIIDPEYHYEALNVEAQQNNPHSLLWWMKHLIALRKQSGAFGEGTLEFLQPENHRVLAFVRRWGDQRILMVANLSRFAQAVELDLSEFQGSVPVEMFGRTAFPAVGALPYFVTLGPHAFYWFSLQSPAIGAARLSGEITSPVLAHSGSWEDLVRGDERELLEGVLPAFFRSRRWFGGKARHITGAEIVDSIPVLYGGGDVYICLVKVAYLDGDSETYVLPLAYASGARGQEVLAAVPEAVVALVGAGVVFDALWDDTFAVALVEGIGRRRRWKGVSGDLAASRTRAFSEARGPAAAPLKPSPVRGEQSNTSIVFGDRLVLKLFRRIAPGINPDLEIGRYLTEHTRFQNVPELAGAVEYMRERSEPMTVAVMHRFVPSEGDAWSFTLDALSQYFDRILAQQSERIAPSLPGCSLLDCLDGPIPPAVEQAVGAYLEKARLLGRRTAELHLALASAADDPNIAPEPFTALYRRSLYQSLRTQIRMTFDLLRKQLTKLPEAAREPAREVIGLQDGLLGHIRGVLERKISKMRIRVHGDFHLGQVLYTGKDFVILDFEGEPSRSLTERRFKRSSLRDVAGMIRSFEYAAAHAVRHGPVRSEDISVLQPWARLWSRWASIAFLQGYLPSAADAPFLPRTREELRVLLDFYLLDKALYELRYELNNRPEWVAIPLEGILDHFHAEVAR